MDAEPVFITGSVFSWESLLVVSIIVAAWFVCRRINVMKRPVWQRRLRRLPRGPSGPGMCFPRGAATPDVTIKLKLGDNMFGFCHRKRGGHDCAEARSCGGEGCPISKEMREAGLISLRRMKEGQKARIAHVQASGELGRRIRDMGLIPGAEVEVVGRAPLRDPVALRLPGFTLSLRNNEADYIVVEPLEQAG